MNSELNELFIQSVAQGSLGPHPSPCTQAMKVVMGQGQHLDCD